MRLPIRRQTAILTQSGKGSGGRQFGQSAKDNGSGRAWQTALADQHSAVAEAVDDKLTAIGLPDSLKNLLSALATRALSVFKWMRSEARDITQKTWKGVKKVIVASLVNGTTGLSFTAADLFLAGGETTRLLAKSYPEWFDWLLPFLNMFGLQDPNEQPRPFVP